MELLVIWILYKTETFRCGHKNRIQLATLSCIMFVGISFAMQCKLKECFHREMYPRKNVVEALCTLKSLPACIKMFLVNSIQNNAINILYRDNVN